MCQLFFYTSKNPLLQNLIWMLLVRGLGVSLNSKSFVRKSANWFTPWRFTTQSSNRLAVNNRSRSSLTIPMIQTVTSLRCFTIFPRTQTPLYFEDPVLFFYSREISVRTPPVSNRRLEAVCPQTDGQSDSPELPTFRAHNISPDTPLDLIWSRG